MKKIIIAMFLTLMIFGKGFATEKWEETFENETPPEGWTIINNDGSNPHIYGDEGDEDTVATVWSYESDIQFIVNGQFLSVRPYEGAYFWHSGWTNRNTETNVIDEWLITPQLPMIEVGDTLSFFAGATDRDYVDSLDVYPIWHDSLRVFVSVSDNAIDSFTELINDSTGYFEVDGPTGYWHGYQFDMSQFAGELVYVAINYYISDASYQGNGENVWVDDFSLFNADTSTVAIEITELGDGFNQTELIGNYPNPFNPSTTILFHLATSSRVSLHIYNAAGQFVCTIKDREPMTQGERRVQFDATGLSSGTYFYQLQTNDRTQIKRMVLLR